MKVAIIVHGRFHAFDLARELHDHDALAGLVTTYPEFMVRRFLPPLPWLRTVPWLEAWRRIHARLGLGPHPRDRIGPLFAKAASFRLPREMDVLVGWSGATLHAIDSARARGAKIVVERGSSHIAHQAAILRNASSRWGATIDPVSRATIEMEEREYDLADRIAVPTGFAKRTFIEKGVPADKVVVNPYGVDLTRFSARPFPNHVRPRVLFVGLVGIRKGIPDLLEAAGLLKNLVDFRLVGPIEPGMRNLLSQHDHVTVTGPLPGTQLAEEYAQADIFVLPSLEEGLPLVLLQAMACGRPVIATPETGIEDLVIDLRDGMITPSCDPTALAAKIEALAMDADLRRHMGMNGRHKVENGYSWQDYGVRALRSYQALIDSEFE